MHVGMVIDRLSFGGAERVALNLSKGFLDKGHTVSLFVIDNIIEMDIDRRIALYNLNFKKSFNQYSRNRKRLYAMLDNIQKDFDTFSFIIVHLYKSSRLMQYYNNALCLHVVHGLISQAGLKGHTGLTYLKKRYRLRSVFNNLNLVCVSEGVKKDLLETMNIAPKSVEVIYNPFNINSIRNDAQEEYSLPFEGKYIIFVGRLEEEKRVPFLIEAYRQSGIKPKLLIVGLGSMEPLISTLIDRYGLQENVFLYGSSYNPFPLIKHAELLVLCSEHEGFPSVLIESLILQTPVVSTYCSEGPKEILQHYTLDALSYENDSIDALAGKLSDFSANAPSVSKTCMNAFASETIIDQYLSYADKLISEKYYPLNS